MHQPKLNCFDVVQPEFEIGSDILNRMSGRHPARKVFVLLAYQLTPATLAFTTNHV